MRFLLFGPPGAGKGTYAHALSERFGIPHISTGDLLRDEIKKKTEVGMRIKQLIGAGQFAPDKLMNTMLKRRLDEEDAQNGFLLDGYPRTVGQAKTLEEWCTPDGVLFFAVSDDVVVERISGRLMGDDGAIYHRTHNPPPQGVRTFQREDDRENVVRERIKVYYEKTHPVIDYYRERGILHEINANGNIDDPQTHIIDDCISIMQNSTKATRRYR